jgi:uncharacterized protein (TIRG00374 family)
MISQRTLITDNFSVRGFMDLKLKQNSFKIFQIVLAAVIVLLILGSIDYFQASKILLHLDWFFLSLAGLCYLLNNIIMSIRLKKILTFLGSKIRFRIAFLSHMSGMLLSDVTPGRSGYLYVGLALTKKGVPLPRGLAAIMSTYIYDLLFKISLALIAVYYLYATITGLPIGYIVYLIVILLLLIIAGYYLIMYPGPVLETFCEKNKYLQYILDLGEQSRAIQKISPYIISISFIGWILRGLEWFFIAKAIGSVAISVIDALLLNPLLTILSLIPVTPAGLGIQEAGIVGILVLLGISLTSATAFAFLTRFVEIIIDLIGLKGFFALDTTQENLLYHYNAIEGDIDEKAYHSDLLVQKYWQQRRTDTLKNMLDARDNEVILDIGCGSGVQLRALGITYPKILIGMDLNRNALLFAKKKGIPESEFIIADAQYLPFRQRSVNKIICAEIIEHLHEPEKIIQETQRVLNDGGRIVISTPNEHSIWGIYEIFWDLFGRGRNYGETHLKFFSVQELYTFFGSCPQRSHQTLFLFSPLFALLNNEKILGWGRSIDGIFEKINCGVIIVMSATKK